MHILFLVEDLNIEQLGISCLSSISKKAGHNVDMAEAKYDKVKRKIKNNNFTILAYSVHFNIVRYYLDLNRKIKEEFKVFSIFGGPQPTAFPEMINEPGLDGVCIGEGEYALLELANNLQEGRPITDIANWWIKQDNQIFRNPTRPLIKDLDTLPFADRTLFSSILMSSVMTSRGCPYLCSFCTAIGEFRRRSVDNVIAELRELKKNINVKFIAFYDTVFNISLDWLREFSGKYRKEIGLPFYCYVRADLVTPESMGYLKEAGCFSVTMGIETANDYLRNEVLKKAISKEQIIQAAEIIKRYKIRLRTTNLLGIPFGSLEDDLDTLRLNIQCRPDLAKASIFFVQKNTAIYNFLAKYPEFKQLKSFLQEDLYVNLESRSSAYKIRKIKNLNQLFGLIVEFPFLLPQAQLLIELPLFRFYLFLNRLWTEYCFDFRIYSKYLSGWRFFFIRLGKYLKRELKKYLEILKAI